MNRKEKKIIWEIIEICKSIPDIKNPCDLQGLGELRIERNIQINTIYDLLYSLIFLQEEDWREEDIQINIKEYKEFVEKRKKIWETPHE